MQCIIGLRHVARTSDFDCERSKSCNPLASKKVSILLSLICNQTCVEVFFFDGVFYIYLIRVCALILLSVALESDVQ